MLEPGRMSWNWLRSSFCHSAPNSFEGYTPPAATDHISASPSACWPSRFNRFVRDWLVYVPRCNSKYSSPTEVARPFASAEAASKNSPARPISTPSLWAESIISGWGPPPPSPQPNRYSDLCELWPSLKLLMLRATSSGWKLPLYVSAGGKWVKIRVPSIPSHIKVWCSGLLVSFHESFWGAKDSEPPSEM